MEVLKKNNLNLEQIDLYVFHQANKYMLEYIKRKLKIPDEKFFFYLSETGNTVSSTIPFALQNAIKNGIIKKGMKILIASFGVGYSYSATIIN